MSAIEITRQDLSILQSRAEAGRTTDAKQARRSLAICSGAGWYSRLLAAQACGMDRQTLRGWVHRYNADGSLVLLRCGGKSKSWKREICLEYLACQGIRITVNREWSVEFPAVV